MLYTIAAADIASELEIVWRREMVTGAYRPAWVDGPHRGRAASGHRLPDQPRATSAMPAGSTTPAIVRSIATACGPLGACADYLFNTTAHLDELGIVDRSLRRLCRTGPRGAARAAG